MVKNLINDFYLVGHKQFTENRVEEENECKLFKNAENEDSFNKKSFDADNLIHEQMKSTLENSLRFVKTKLNELNDESNSQHQLTDLLNQDEQVEKLIKLNKYHQKKLPPIVNSDEFMNEIFKVVKEQSIKTVKTSSSLNSSNSTDSKPNTETSSIISELENVSINQKILEINENNFIEHLSAAQQSSTSFEDVRIQTDSTKQILKSSTQNSDKLNFSTNLDQSQTYKQDKIDVLNENVNLVREQLDAIFGKASGAAKNRNLFEDDSDDEELFKTASQNQKRTKDLFKSDSEEESIDISKKSDLFESNSRATKFKKNNSENENRPTLIENKQVLNEKSNTLNNLFDSDSEDELFSTKIDEPTLKVSSEIKNKDIEIDKKQFIEESIKEPVEKSIRQQISPAESNSSIEQLSTVDTDKMSNKKELFKNQLEDLFSKKRKPSLGFIKVNREKADSQSETETEKNIENQLNPSKSSSIHKVTNQISQIDQDLSHSIDLSSINTSTLDNNLVKARVKPLNRKKPTGKFNSSTNIKSDQKNDQSKEPIKSIKKNEILNESKFKVSIDKEDDKSNKEETVEKVIDKNVTKGKIVNENATKDTNQNEIIKKKPLFLDSDDEDKDDFFKQINKTSERKQSLKESLDKKFSKLFDDSDDDDVKLFASSSKTPSLSQNKQTKDDLNDKKKVLSSSLFDNSDSDDELFKK